MRYVPIRLKKRRSTAALHNASEFSISNDGYVMGAAVFRRGWIAGSLAESRVEE